MQLIISVHIKGYENLILLKMEDYVIENFKVETSEKAQVVRTFS